MTDRFPATTWLVGAGLVTDAARAFVVAHPPSRPCLAEYGSAFPKFLAGQPGATDLAYLGDFSALEWRVGEVAVEVDGDGLTIDRLASITPEKIANACVRLQPGVRYLSASWNVDELMMLYLSDSEPEEFRIVHGPVGIEVRGARGDVRITRLPTGDFTFRSALADRCSVTDAAERAISADETLNPAQALVSLMATGLVTAIEHTTERSVR